MHILIGLGVALALLYYWLTGRRFARVVMVILLIPLAGCLSAWVFSTAPGVTTAGIAFGGLIGAVAGWFLAGWPTYYQEARVRRFRQMPLSEMYHYRQSHPRSTIAANCIAARQAELLTLGPSRDAQY